MSPSAFITGADRGLGLALSANLLQQGWTVFAGQYMEDWPELKALQSRFPQQLFIVPLDVASDDSVSRASHHVGTLTRELDLLINNAGIGQRDNFTPIEEGLAYDEMMEVYNINSLGPLRVVEGLLPLLRKGKGKRLCFISSEAGSIGRSERTSWFGYGMSKAALNMAVKNLFNHLRPRGFRFRLCHPGWMRTYMGGSKNDAADLDPEYVAERIVSYILDDTVDEDKLVMRDMDGKSWPW
ncbi:SDR family oxidoreductase [Puniceicoccales bacterium CK1056]|uniref:SDR family oxidoreductase n=1 Tax=Oceanipulchritudo coccoides TaxID=2706888 RepID=A0A6B2M5C0_9BACT|nr:SDR family oxidoreductase [Oceanipulchritudo coccoides]NDV62860.1 SDR family oxidoreductase [Oceanipulchritudo coccoides]